MLLCYQFCLEKGIIPIWDCDALNAPSVNLAKKLGFEPLTVYHLYYKSIGS
ncbi:GNAT family N-acetyltransferase [Ornithinibacillus sp. BX22]|uniref:GNAT family N-acetyltransferase n=1 Tax=Ornithinibacillus hominis TaxID=2763055 RepID=A0A923RL52_9BACI|nr:GNAT family N-acetyltransferase [Ornithinibacillus hominis]